MASNVGFGVARCRIAIYIANRPPLPCYQTLSSLTALSPLERENIVLQTSNHWRKIFNVFAKLMFALDTCGYKRWQCYRDKHLLQAHSHEALMFSPPKMSGANVVHVVAGKTYAAQLNIDFPLTWLDTYFAINKEQRLIVSPYLDYRQLSNQRIDYLVNLIQSMSS